MTRPPRSQPQVTALASGVLVASWPMAEVETASLAVTVGAGSRSERPEEAGLAHLMEHMAFKGTRRRSARAIAEVMDAVGGDLNASTGAESTAYHARVVAGDLPLAMDVIGDILTDPLIDAGELERECAVIAQEIAGVEDDPDDQVFDLFTEAAFPDQPLGRPIFGTRSSIQAMDRERVLAFLAREYRAGSTVVTAAGAVDHAEVVALAEAHLAGFAPGKAPAPAPATYRGGEYRRATKGGQAHVVLGLSGPGLHEADHAAGLVFANVVGGGASSRLFQEVREERGLAYEVEAFHWGFADTGLFGMHLATDERDAPEALIAAIGCLADAAEGADEAEAARGRASLRAGLLTALESSASRAEGLARHLLAHGRPVGVDEQLERIAAVDAGALRRVGARLLASAPTLAALGPVRRLPRLHAVAARLGARPAAA